ncbi:MAG: sugar ABC transporter ATP-binding protein [Oscillospiraceae bacterium]|nr:sugar ABC transporter ATP-binding protein [Oscillospiraceae bacterium]MDD4368234.1 sugar ABC transporter ATP-binding protein [Oscillospiraceae bacterium]
MANDLLEMKHITKVFPGVKALDDVNFVVKKGEIHALVGENGAGKSTLMNILSGIYPYGSYDGDIIYRGEVQKFNTIRDSENKGIVIIHQELALVPEMTIGENMFLGVERGHRFNIDWDETYALAAKYLNQVGLKESPHTLIKDIGTGKQQLVEIAKALAKNAELLILDEPTSSLNEDDSKALLDLLLSFKKQGHTSIIISHKISEISYCADTITILRDGATIESLRKGKDEISDDRIIQGMVGRQITDRFPKRPPDRKLGDIALEVKNWTTYNPVYTDKKVVDDVSFYVRSGEVIGIAGLMGAGRTELMMSIFGHSYGTATKGELKIHGQAVNLNTPRDAIEHKLAYVTEDRKGNGLILSNEVTINTSLANLKSISNRFNVIDRDKEIHIAKDYVRKLEIKCPSVLQNVDHLSGGNQQKVLLAKWMFADPDILILDEPTRGIDVGAKYEIYTIINDLITQGKSVIMVSSELPEIIGMSDRIYIMNEGQMVGELAADGATQEGIMNLIQHSKA